MLFVGAQVAGVKVESVISRLMPFFLALVAVLLLVTFVPALSLWLPGLFGLPVADLHRHRHPFERQPMEQRYATSPEHVPGMDTDELRRRYLVETSSSTTRSASVYTHHDRVVLLGAMPGHRPDLVADLPGDPLASTSSSTARPGSSTSAAPGRSPSTAPRTTLGHGACLYVGRGAVDVVFASTDAGGAGPRVLPRLGTRAHRLPDDARRGRRRAPSASSATR